MRKHVDPLYNETIAKAVYDIMKANRRLQNGVLRGCIIDWNNRGNSVEGFAEFDHKLCGRTPTTTTEFICRTWLPDVDKERPEFAWNMEDGVFKDDSISGLAQQLMRCSHPHLTIDELGNSIYASYRTWYDNDSKTRRMDFHGWDQADIDKVKAVEARHNVPLRLRSTLGISPDWTCFNEPYQAVAKRMLEEGKTHEEVMTAVDELARNAAS